MLTWLKKIRAPAALKRETATRENDPYEYGALGGILDISQYDPTILRKSRSGEGVKLYRDCEQDARVSALLDIRKAGVLQNRWSVVPGGDSAADKRAADLCRRWLDETDAYQMFRALLDSTLYGYAISELLWDSDGLGEGWWLPREVRNKQPERFAFTENFELRLLTRRDSYDGEPTLPGKFIVCRRDPKMDNPHGVSLGTTLWWLCWFRRHGAAFWARYADRYGAPWTVAKYPQGANQGDRNKVLSMLRSLRRDTGVAIPEGYALELLAEKGSGTDLHERWMRWLNEEVTVRILGSTLTTSTSGASGSRAAGEVHERVSAAVIFDDAQRLEETISRQAFRWITELNIAGAKPPRLRFDLPAITQQIQRAERDIKLRELGYAPKDRAEYARTYFGMEIDENFAPPDKNPRGDRPPQFAESEFERRKERAREIVRAADVAAAEVSEDLWKEMRDELLDDIGAVETPEELDALVDEIIAAAPGGKTALSERLRDAMLSAELGGMSE